MRLIHVANVVSYSVRIWCLATIKNEIPVMTKRSMKGLNLSNVLVTTLAPKLI